MTAAPAGGADPTPDPSRDQSPNGAPDRAPTPADGRRTAGPGGRSGSLGVIARLDRTLGRLPMYRLVLLCLAVLAVLAVLASFVHLVGQPPAALLATLVVSVGVSWLAGRLFGALARTPAYTPSALITGLLLFFIVFPTTAPGDLLVIAAVALVAAASKYLLVVGGRHVLNPAATGMFLVGLTGLGASAWWVATLFLLPFVVVFGLLVLIRMRMVRAGVLFVLVAVVLEVAGQIAFGATPNAALASALVSTPVLFVAGFMLTEPFTLPARTWQRMVEMAVVAVVIALPYLAPFRLLTLGPSPELAILVGNVLSLLLARPAAARLRFAGRRPLTATSTEFAFTPQRPFTHAAGQYLELQLPRTGVDRRGTRRTLTIVSAPGDASGEVKVAMRTREPLSSFKQALDALPLGSPLRATTVGGAFTLPKDRSVPLLLVASGIGITPFVSQLQAEIALVAAGARPRDILLVDRLPSPDELPYADVLTASGARVLLVTPEAYSLAEVGLPDHWHLAERFDAETLRGVLTEPGRRIGYVAGSPGFVARARTVLRSCGVRRIRVDAFSGY